MYVIGGRGGLVSVLLGFFILGIVAGLKILFYLFVAAVGIVYYSGKGIVYLYRRHKGKKLAEKQAVSLQNPPMPVMSKAGPRDWTPRN